MNPIIARTLPALSIGPTGVAVTASDGAEYPGHARKVLDRQVDRVGIGIVADYATTIACGK